MSRNVADPVHGADVGGTNPRGLEGRRSERWDGCGESCRSAGSRRRGGPGGIVASSGAGSRSHGAPCRRRRPTVQTSWLRPGSARRSPGTLAPAALPRCRSVSTGERPSSKAASRRTSTTAPPSSPGSRRASIAWSAGSGTGAGDARRCPTRTRSRWLRCHRPRADPHLSVGETGGYVESASCSVGAPRGIQHSRIAPSPGPLWTRHQPPASSARSVTVINPR
jgi:hypothetical protein